MLNNNIRMDTDDAIHREVFHTNHSITIGGGFPLKRVQVVLQQVSLTQYKMHSNQPPGSVEISCCWWKAYSNLKWIQHLVWIGAIQFFCKSWQGLLIIHKYDRAATLSLFSTCTHQGSMYANCSFSEKDRRQLPVMWKHSDSSFDGFTLYYLWLL